jgi:hypothetical protein
VHAYLHGQGSGYHRWKDRCKRYRHRFWRGRLLCIEREGSLHGFGHSDIPLLAISLAKSGDLASYDHVGQQITYIYTVTNTGTTNLLDPITVQDDRTQVICQVLAPAGLAPGASITCTATYNVSLDDMSVGTITNTASAYSGAVSSLAAMLSIPVDARPALTLVKTAIPASYDTAGGIITYNLMITNSGNVPLAGPLVITDDLSSVWLCSLAPVVELLPGETLACTATLTIASAGNSFSNTATVSLKYKDAAVTSNASTATVYYIAPIPAVTCSQYLLKSTCLAHSGCSWDQTLNGGDGGCFPTP